MIHGASRRTLLFQFTIFIPPMNSTGKKRLELTSRPRSAASLLLLLCLVLAGCSEEINTTYGQRKGPLVSSSVNGTAVLGEMFENAGHKVFSWGILSPRLRDRADCIVWFPNDFEPPTEDVRKWLEAWLLDAPGRTLIYVGRDFDAESWYWEAVEADAPDEQRRKIRLKKRTAKREFGRARLDTKQQQPGPTGAKTPQGEITEFPEELEADVQDSTSEGPTAKDPDETNGFVAKFFESLKGSQPDWTSDDWFVVDNSAEHRKVRTLQSDNLVWQECIERVDASQLEIELNRRVLLPPSAETLLQSEDDVLIGRDWWGDSQLIVVANGSFLLNLPLVNHEHRKLAGTLIDEVGPPSQTVVFLESYAGGPRISDKDPSASMPTGLEIAIVHPTRWIFLHLAVVGVLFCISRWPIFGLPRQLKQASTSDFGQHVSAMAELLQRSRDESYAMTRFLHYQQTTRGNE